MVLWTLGILLVLVPGCNRSETTTVPQPKAPVAGAATDSAVDSGGAIPPAGDAPDVVASLRGEQLYAAHCAACHGEAGDGNGPAAKFLYPRPRDFREGQFRLVTTTNLVPSDADLMRVIERGMPGSAMFPFEHLPENDRAALVEQVRTLVRRGLEDRMRRESAEFGEEVDPEMLAEFLDARTVPGPLLDLPSDPPGPSAESVARGKELYTTNCASCHGETGRGDGVQEQRDSTGMPIRPRDFTRGIFKGGREREQLYARILLGAPGTPMPASTFPNPAAAGDLIDFILSLSDARASAEVEHKRTRLVARRVDAEMPAVIPDSAWDVAEPTSIVVSPLWWRDYAPPDLRVQALHDGRTLALRLSWRDATRNDAAIRPQDFPDKVALQLFRGEHEPFLGMGALDGAVDIWLWDAAAQADLERFADVETAYPEMAVDMYPFEEPSSDAAHPTDQQPREFLSAWAAGNPRSDPTRPLPGSSHQARGVGTLTTHPIASQAVEGRGTWNEGGWTIVLRRPLQVSPGDGLALAAGDRLSIAFAVWDGEARDRDGQKLVSIWHDLELERDGASQVASTNGARR